MSLRIAPIPVRSRVLLSHTSNVFLFERGLLNVKGDLRTKSWRGLRRGLGRLNASSPSEVTFNSDDSSSFRVVGPNNREIDLGLNGDVKIIRQDVDRHMRDDFGNLRLRKASLLHLIEIGVTDVTTFLQ